MSQIAMTRDWIRSAKDTVRERLLFRRLDGQRHRINRLFLKPSAHRPFWGMGRKWPLRMVPPLPPKANEKD